MSNCALRMTRHHSIADITSVIGLMALTLGLSAQPDLSWDKQGWLKLSHQEGASGWSQITLPINQIASISQHDRQGGHVTVGFDASKDGSIAIQAPPHTGAELWLEKLQPDTQMADGRWHLVGQSDRSDRRAGTIEASRPGTYEAEVLIRSTQPGTWQLTLDMGQSTTTTSVTIDESFSGWRTHSLGRVRVTASGAQPWSLRAQSPSPANGPLSMAHVILRTAAEGEPISQRADGSITLHARDVRIHGTKLQYEPLPHKNTVGYWVNLTDQPSWNFECLRPGRYAVEILQGCGKGHGGSLVQVSVNQSILPFLVEETGHFQHFVPRIIGEVALKRPDHYELRIIPIRKAGGAVMDVRQVRLIPLAETPGS